MWSPRDLNLFSQKHENALAYIQELIVISKLVFGTNLYNKSTFPLWNSSDWLVSRLHSVIWCQNASLKQPWTISSELHQKTCISSYNLHLLHDCISQSYNGLYLDMSHHNILHLNFILPTVAEYINHTKYTIGYNFWLNVYI